MACNADIPKTTRFYLGDIDAAADSLRDMGYFTQNERDFIAKFVYRYPEAINAVSGVVWSQTKVEGLHVSYGAPSQQTPLPSSLDSPATVKIESISSPPQSKTTSNEVVEKLSSTNQNSEAKKLELFVQLCHERKFSVKPSNQTQIGSPLSRNNFVSHPVIPDVTIIPPTPTVEAFEPDAGCNDAVTGGNQRHSGSRMLEKSMQEASKRHPAALSTISESDQQEIQEGKVIDTSAKLAKASEAPYIGPYANLRDYGANRLTRQILDEEIHYDSTNGNLEVVAGDMTAGAGRTDKWGKPITDKTANHDCDVVGGSTVPHLSRGRAMLEKMGWEDGQGLGRHNCGTLEPVIQIVKASKTGLGLGRTDVNFDPIWPSSENTPLADQGAQSGWDHSPICDEKTLRSYTKIPALLAPMATSKKTGSKKNSGDGIMVKFIKEGLGSGYRDLKVLAHLQHKNEYKKTRHYLGLEVEALSSQQAADNRHPYMNKLQVNVGDRLQLLNMSGSNEFVATVVGTRFKGFVAIECVKMEKEPVYEAEEEVFGVWTGSFPDFDTYAS